MQRHLHRRNAGQKTTVDRARGSDHAEPRNSWYRQGLLAGLVATGLMTITLVMAYFASLALGDPAGDTPQRWLWALTHNPLTEAVSRTPLLIVMLQLGMGITFSLVYAFFAEPRLPGPGWLRGVTFSLVPWFLSVVVFFPFTGAGVFGLALGAGPLPALGNLIVHLVYGFALGGVYGIPETAGVDPNREDRTATVRINQAAATGILAGTLIGAGIGLLVEASTGSTILPPGGMTLGGALIGGSWGAFVGALAGIGPGPRARGRHSG